MILFERDDVMTSRNWYRLDNSAKIMPCTTTNLNTNVFRLTCTLFENVDEKILQEALDKTLIEYPMYLCTMKDGLFWHYLEKVDYKPLVKEEKTHVCNKMNKDILFRVLYYKKRIHLEVYHALSDGNGAMEFFKYLICTYINIVKNLKLNIPLNDSSTSEKEKDDFSTFDKSNFKFTINKRKIGYKFKHTKKDTIKHDVIEMHLPVDKIKSIAKKYNTTVTVYLTSVYIKSIIDNMKVKELKRPVGITIPVDLRSIFPSKTIRNFFYTFLVSYKAIDKDVTVEEIVKVIAEEFKAELTKDCLQEKLNSYMLLEKLLVIRIIPNFIKDLGLKYFAIGGKKGQTSVLSNLGIIKIPDEYAKYVDSFTAIASTEDLSLTVCSFKNKLVLSFSSHFVSKDIERCFLKELQKEINDTILIVSNIKEAE